MGQKNHNISHSSV